MQDQDDFTPDPTASVAAEGEASKELRIWKHIAFTANWRNCDTSVLDDIAESWFIRRQKLQGSSVEFKEFMEQLKRRHAIETGIVERMYDLSTGMTEIFVQEGFKGSLLSHNDTNIDPKTLMQHLNDHLEAVNWVFDIIKEDRPFSVSMIKQLHQLVTRHQDTAEGRDAEGRKLKIRLLKGEFKKTENNPTRPDGVKIYYCPPDHVDAEMDNLIAIFNQLREEGVHPLIVAAWVHHAFTAIHPFQDGNGRVVRLLASLILVKEGFFPLTVLREEAKSRYIEALEKADAGDVQPFVNYLGEIQKRNIQEALNVQEVSPTSSFEVVQNALLEKIREHKQSILQQKEEQLSIGRRKIFSVCHTYLQEVEQNLKKKYGKDAGIYLKKCSFDDREVFQPTQRPRQDFYFNQIITYAQKHNYFFNRNLPKAWLILGFDFSAEKKYHIGFTIHHFGYEDGALAIGVFLEHKGEHEEDTPNIVLPLGIPPHVVSAYTNGAGKEANIRRYLEDTLTAVLAQIASEF
ncbi:MAG: Fic family protein [Saprospiraceae bacterium]|nr:Fic family protein [Saprospiraceae bacterium]